MRKLLSLLLIVLLLCGCESQSQPQSAPEVDSFGVTFADALEEPSL